MDKRTSAKALANLISQLTLPIWTLVEPSPGISFSNKETEKTPPLNAKDRLSFKQKVWKDKLLSKG